MSSGPEDEAPASDLIDLARILDWDEVIDQISYYEILGLAPSDERERVRQAFHAFALAFHPDSFRNDDIETQAAARRVFERGVEAYRTLSDAELRAEYDLALAKGELRLGRGARREGLGVGAKSLDEVCRAPAAKLHARHAEQMIAKGDLKEAKLALFRALRGEDGPNPELAERIEALEALQAAAGEPW